MKKGFLGVFLSTFIAAVCTVTMVSVAYAADSNPSLKAISFKNAVIAGEFSAEQNEYQITLADNSVTPTVDSYEINGDAELFVEYITNEACKTVGMSVTLKYDTGTHIYNFYYSNPSPYDVSSNSFLADIYCNLGELDQEINHDSSSYKLYIPSDLTQLTITPVTEDANAYCPSVNLTLNEGQTQKLQLYSVASDGSKREYSLELKRVNKTVEQVKTEMKSEDYSSFVDGTRVYQRPEFFVILGSTVAGIIIIFALYSIAKRISVNPYDSEERPFYKAE